MDLFTVLLLTLPTLFLIVSVLLSVRAVKRGTKTKKAAIRQIVSFCVVCLIVLAVPMGANAAEAQETAQTAAAAADGGISAGLGMLASALAVGIAGIGGGIAVAGAAPAAIGATSEDPKVFGKAMIFVALGEGIALYGLLIAILILQKF
jgi:V/A-type H+-transporting ATPase subunit K